MSGVDAISSETSGLLAFAIGYAAMLVIPGPSFAVVSQASLLTSRREAGLVAMGLACGAALLVMLVLRGAANLPASEALEECGRLAGTLILLIVGLRAVGRSLRPMAAPSVRCERGRIGRHFAIGLITAATNPISFAFFSSAALAARSTQSEMTSSLLPAGVFVMALGWFGFLAMLLSQPSVRSIYGHASRQFDGLLGALAIAVAIAWLAPSG